VKLDEWGGLEEGSTFTSEYDVQTKFIQPLGISEDRYLTLDPFTTDAEEECKRMKFELQNSVIDICILGIGVNGHIALNEPAEILQSGFHIAQLAESTLNNGMIKSLKQPPTFGMTMGVGEILRSRKILLFISGSGKKAAFEKLLKEEVSTQFPASLLWLHPNVDVLVDERVV
jgi:galactosamine-6-phosphate isomerase